MQLLVLLLFHQSSATLNLFLKISIGFRLISELNLKYLPLPTRLFMVSLLPTLKISKTTIHHATLGLQTRIYLWSLCLAQIVMAVVLFLFLWNSLPQHIRDAGSLDIFKRRLKTALSICAFYIRKCSDCS